MCINRNYPVWRQKETKWKKYEENIKELWDVYNRTNVGISEREMNTILERKKKEGRKM